MKKLLTILTSTSAIFLITAGIVLVNKEDNLRINYNLTYYQRNEIKDGKLVKIGYYQWGKHKRIEQIPTTINVIAAELPKEITSLRYAFAAARHNVTWEVKWDTSNVTDMNSLFYGRDQFNSSDILDWDTSNVTDMSEMFSGATEFNQDLSKWDVSKVQNFEKMFEGAKKFNNDNKPLDWGLKLKSVKKMKKMFKNASSFKQNLNSWVMRTNVDMTDFGLEKENQPTWYTEPKKIETPEATSTKANNQNETSETLSNTQPKENETITDNLELESTPNNITQPIEPSESSTNLEDKIENELSTSDQSNQTEPLPNPVPDSTIENETIEKSTNSKDDISPKSNNEKNLIIPYAKSSLKNVSNWKTKAIVSGVVGSTAVITTTSVAGFSYYYRKSLKDLFLKLKKRWFKSN
ncbi:BspA family leucine-rich repeat surface protein [Mycoplasma mycoides]|uniref:BspA family leucine-rich repeat surface protein n=1 Tax=Mycoplasma mycoides TaxID=2102 RepID=UPI002734A9E8|nr:BspA family leucine-rich repeat surface protein [Mycoplasma mycoides]MDP4040149.1 BspA family leucine-rich repeat surface protein [Mycoplasma mycoides]MDP4040887.1 BspA family leucine-rich repeat surface protein [Mycoplasma mycoides]MDP4041910.1 BspA family leucine-rich repeat surface protein [Mycoplasma mycoides]MDP4043312.1 BspA family leucine-rich repeat surface protein [Mycoplasma mycoides]MDP4044179.1 BspA family leucine-rich repeat surface protein [Mycoplasma mycoides]